MKLYIPTCTLNFNNIFSTESISPAWFYDNRGFGNKRFYKVEANDIDNAILLYSKFPQFKVKNEELENGPMVIEIETDGCPYLSVDKIDELNGVQVYASSATIYLTPFNTNVYFESYQDLQSVLTKSEQSLENKYSNLYSRNFKLRKKMSWSISTVFSEKDYFEWNSSFKRNTFNLPQGNPLIDLFLDRLKGCLVCYQLGANSSVSPEIAKLKQLARKIRNVLSAIVNSPDHKPTEIQDNTLLSYINEFQGIYSKLDDNSQYNSQLINDKLISPSTGLSKDILYKVLSDLRLTDAFLKRLPLRLVYDVNDIYNCLFSTTISESYQIEISRMNDAIKRLEALESSKCRKYKLSELIVYENQRLVVRDSKTGQGSFFPTLLESQMKGDYKKFMDENGVEENLAVAFVGGAKLKSFIPNEWEGSSYQTYINGLLGNLQKGEPFNIFSIDNPILQSFAAFCQKGEDIDRLRDYMLQFGFDNYQFALAIYGATRGFASLPKTFTNPLFCISDFYVDFYKDLSKMMFNVEISAPHFATNENLNNTSNLNSINLTTYKSSINKNDTSEDEPRRSVEDVSKIIKDKHETHNPKLFIRIADNILGTRTHAYKALKSSGFENDHYAYSEGEFRKKIFSIIDSSLPSAKSSRRDIIDKINKCIELETKSNDLQAFIVLLDNYLKSDDAAYKKLIKLVSKDGNSKIESPMLNFAEYNDCSNYPSQLPKIDAFLSFSARVLRRLEQNWIFTSKDYPNNRVEHIRYFLNLCKKEGRGKALKMTSLYGVFTESVAAQAEKELNELYHA